MFHYDSRSKSYPCFGANAGLTTRQWWFEVVRNTYLGTEFLTEIDKDEMEQLLPKLFEALYDDVFSTKEGWSLKDDTVYTLRKLQEWRDQGNGPKLGVVSNFDERLPAILIGLLKQSYYQTFYPPTFLLLRHRLHRSLTPSYS